MVVKVRGAVLSAQVLSAWAKSDKHGQHTQLVRHSCDAAAVAGQLWDAWIPGNVREVLSAGKTPAEARSMACWLAAIHDIGKLAPAFACQVPELAGAMRDTGLDFGVRQSTPRRTPHSVISHRAIEDWLRSLGWSRRAARSLAVIAGGHHGVPPEHHDLLGKDVSMIGGPPWAAARIELLDYLARHTGARSHLQQWSQVELTPAQQMLWTAVVIVSDWIASDADRFPLGQVRDSESTAAQAFADLALPPPWIPTLDSSAQSALDQCGVPGGVTPNAVQLAAFDAAHALAGPGLMIIEAPMGCGKTEAALMAARQLGAYCNSGGMFVALPTMATSNAMFSRVLRWMSNDRDMGATSVVLAHGKAHLNAEYRGLADGWDLAGISCDGGGDAAVVAHQWLSGRRKATLANFVVGTIDQVLFAALKSRYLALRHLGIAGKVVVVDEVHAADDYMRQYLLRALEWLGAYRVPVVLLSATLPPAQRLAYMQAYTQPVNLEPGSVRDAAAYPRVTAVSAAGAVSTCHPAAPAHTTSVRLERLDDAGGDLVALLRERLRSGGTAAVVHNTVRRAQDTARLLTAEFGDDVILLHSGFIAADRAAVEARLCSELGRDGQQRPARRIVVATQVIEQSLDVDFDFMVSDLAPIDLLLQRIGRLHRHRRSRPEQLSCPTLVVTGVTDWNCAIPVPVAGSERVYGLSHLLRALAVLDSRESILIPTDIPAMVAAAFDPEFVGPRGWSQALVAAYASSERARVTSESAAQAFRIRRPSTCPTLVGLLSMSLDDSDAARGGANVRDGLAGIEVLLTRRVGGVVRLVSELHPNLAVAVDSAPAAWVARAALDCSVRLPFALSHPGIAGDVIAELERRNNKCYPGWLESPWLKGELALELREDMSTTVAGFSVSYDRRFGLVVEKEAP